jgi:hypothetical protein
MSNFDIEQCKKDGGLAMNEHSGEVKIIVFEKDPDGYYIAQKTEDLRYYIVSDEYLTNIPKKKKKKITIYVYQNDDVNIWASSEHLPCENNQAKLIKTIKEEIET